MTSGKLPNRWGIALAAVLMQICLGAIYGWSVFKKPLMSAGHWTETAVQLNFTLAIFLTGAGAIVGGLWQDKAGPRKVAATAGVIYGIGYMVAGFAASHHSLYGLYLGYGFLTGVGMGMGYICPVATLVKWFPDRRGLMTGVAVCGYGFGALIMSPLAAWEVIKYGLPATFWTLGIVYLIVVFTAAQFYATPPQGWRPEGWEPRTTVAKAASTYDFTVGEALGTWQFYLLFAMLFLNVSAGIMIISQASPMAQEMVGMTVLQAAGMVGLIALSNGLGRVFWAWVSDHIGRARVYFLLYLIQVIIFFMLPRLSRFDAFQPGIRAHRPVLWRWLRHHAFLHRGFFRSQVNGRYLRHYPNGLGTRSHSLANHDRACPPEHRKICAGDQRHHGGDALLTDPAIDRAQARQRTDSGFCFTRSSTTLAGTESNSSFPTNTTSISTTPRRAWTCSLRKSGRSARDASTRRNQPSSPRGSCATRPVEIWNGLSTPCMRARITYESILPHLFRY